MKPFYTKATTQFDNSITIRYDEREQFYPHWHYHNEYEIVYIHKSKGVRYVGDSINPFEPGDFVFLGSGLPHIWMNENDVFDSEIDTPKAISTVLHIQPKFVNNSFFELPLLRDVKHLFEQSEKGIRFIGFEGIEEALNKIHRSHSTERVIAVFELLSRMSKHKQIEYLSSTKSQLGSSRKQNDRITQVHDYIANHFREQMSLSTLAEIVHMTPQAFCNFFKKKNTKTVFTYINDLKLGYSCKLLIETELNVDQIANESGYNNTTFFNRKFKSKMGLTPTAYRKKHAINESTAY